MYVDDGTTSLAFDRESNAAECTDGLAIRVSNLSKRYEIYDDPRDRLKQFVAPRLQRLAGRSPKQYFHEFWALRNVSIEVEKGETVGIIGRNGSGKTTLLQIICGTLAPTEGSVVTKGRIAALLELGSGFNPEFTGRENVYMNGVILGMSTKEIDARFDDIAAFADIGEFIEQPVKTYSSGMFVRLAFAINILAEPAIMIVDEALAVGDMNFQAKCMTALTRIQQRGVTVLFVSHDIGALKTLCSRGVYLEHGTVRSIGRAPEIAEQYVRTMREELNAEARRFTRAPSEFAAPQVNRIEGHALPVDSSGKTFRRSVEFEKRVAAFRYGTGEVRVAYAELLDTSDQQIQVVDFNQEVRVRIYVESASARHVSVNFSIRDDKKVSLTGCGFRQVDRALLATCAGGRYLVDYSLRLPLQEGRYSLLLEITSPLVRGETAEFLDVIEDAVVFQMRRWEHSRVWSKVHLFPTLRLESIDGDG